VRDFILQVQQNCLFEVGQSLFRLVQGHQYAGEAYPRFLKIGVLFYGKAKEFPGFVELSCFAVDLSRLVGRGSICGIDLEFELEFL